MFRDASGCTMAADRVKGGTAFSGRGPLWAFLYHFLVREAVSCGDDLTRLLPFVYAAVPQVMDLECEAKAGVGIPELTWIHTHKTAALLKVHHHCPFFLWEFFRCVPFKIRL